MAIVISAVFPGAGLDDYREVHRRIIEAGPEGLLIHTAGVTDEGLKVFDVWESPEAFQRFQETMLRGAIEGTALGDVQGRFDSWELANAWTPGASQLAGMDNFGVAA
jgi:hypothetical protein